MKGVVTAWMASWGVIAYSDLRYEKRAPIPSEMLMPSILFIGLGLAAEVSSIEKAAGAAAWGLVLMAFLVRQGHYSGPGSGLFGAPAGRQFDQYSPGSGDSRGGRHGHIPPGRKKVQGGDIIPA